MKPKTSRQCATLRGCFPSWACLLLLAVSAANTYAGSSTQALEDAAPRSAAMDSVAVESVAMDQVHWLLTSDRFRCELKLDLKKNGAVNFVQLAGEQLQLVYAPASDFSGAVHIAAATPAWQAPAQSRFEPLKESNHGRYVLAADQASALLRSLDQGLWTLLQLDQQATLIPTIRWQEASAGFQACRNALSPLSIKQARDLTLYYQAGQRVLSHDQLSQLEELSQYLQIDAKVSRILVDAYTDDNGSRAANLQISRERAADVADALRSGGVSGELIEQRAHGDRYPSADNGTPEGRNLNRKVTIRVIRKNG